MVGSSGTGLQHVLRGSVLKEGFTVASSRLARPHPRVFQVASVEGATAWTQREAQDDAMQPRQPQPSRQYPLLANFGSAASAPLSGPHG